MPTFEAIDPKDIRAQASADGHVIQVTDDRLRIASDDRVRLDVSLDDLRRVQFDIERDRPATLVLVPDGPSDEPQVIVVRRADIEGVATALAALGVRLDGRKG